MLTSISFKIFWVFFKLSLVSFGGLVGILPEMERILVTENQWLSHDQFIQSYVLAQFVPGPNMVMCPMVGYHIDGWGGFVAGFFGIYTAPILIMGTAYAIYHRFRNVSIVRKLELALRPLVVGLLAASAIQLWIKQGTTLHNSLAISVILASVLTVGGLALSLRNQVGPLKLIFGLGATVWAFQGLV